ncbi:MAG TPA: hypothetical protein VM616_04185 [Gammaproteobacteria bacterium]|nr:hypothetical protein [Gammaproteobacteria bacterium]
MNIPKKRHWLTVAVASFAITGCGPGPQDDAVFPISGTETEPFILFIPTDGRCPTADPLLHVGTACDPENLGILCVPDGKWVRWTSKGNPIEAISKKQLEEDFLKCKNNDPSLCKLKKMKDPGATYDYDVTLDGCPVWDPKIIITN